MYYFFSRFLIPTMNKLFNSLFIKLAENGEQQVPRLNSKSSLAPIKKSASTTTPKRPSAPPPLPPRQISLGRASSPVSRLKSKCSFKKYDAPVLPAAVIAKSESFNNKKIPPPLPLHPPPPIPQTKYVYWFRSLNHLLKIYFLCCRVRIAPRAPSSDLEKRFHFLPLPNLVDLPKSFDLPKERKYPSELNCKKYHN